MDTTKAICQLNNAIIKSELPAEGERYAILPNVTLLLIIYARLGDVADAERVQNSVPVVLS